ncbi:MAG: ABC transporter permease [Bryobacteraceae bacterium]
MWERIAEIIRKELLQVFRNRRTRTALFIPPMIQLIVFGYAVNLDVDHIKTAFMDEDHSPMSRDLMAAFSGSGRFEVQAYPQSEEEARKLLDEGRVLAVVRVLPGFAKDLERARNASVQLLIDGTNSNTASLVQSYASEIVAGYDRNITIEQQIRRAMASGGNVSLRAPQIDTRSRVWFNPDLRSRNYFVPGVMTNLIMVVTVMLTAMGIVREKEMGTMEQLMVTPIRPLELMIGKTLPFAAVGLMDVMMVTTLALLVFHVPFRGNFLLLLFCATLFLMTSLGTGLFISTISKTQQQALMSSFFFATPTFMLSGFAFPIRNMPEVVQYLTYLNPLRYFVEIVRGIFLRGTGIDVLWPQMTCLAIYGTLILLAAANRFHKRLD